MLGRAVRLRYVQLLLTLAAVIRELPVVADAKRTRDRQDDDVLAVARCEAACWTQRNKQSCIKLCLLKGHTKPGLCPKEDEGFTLPPFASVCLNACKIDTECADINKCCRHHCGITCQTPKFLQTFEGLPEIPYDITLRGKRKRSLYIKWKTGRSTSGTVIYVIQERHHTGKYFIENHLTDWKSCYRSQQSSVVLKHIVKPGRWYQFRVAAVNANGTKGFSEYVGYVSNAGPKPPKAPQNLTVGPLVMANGSLRTELYWSQPLSDLPILKYKVFWSRRLHGATALDSVLVLQHKVSKDRTRFTIHDLEPDSMYFLQVQAISQFGQSVFRGEKSGVVLNTTNYANESHVDRKEMATTGRKIENLQLTKLFWSGGDLKARVTWSKEDGAAYSISWRPVLCKRNKMIMQNKSEFTTKGGHFDIFSLHFDCRYKVSIRKMLNKEVPSVNTFVTFSTPSCKYFKRKNKRVRCHKKRSFN